MGRVKEHDIVSLLLAGHHTDHNARVAVKEIENLRKDLMAAKTLLYQWIIFYPDNDSLRAKLLEDTRKLLYKDDKNAI